MTPPTIRDAALSLNERKHAAGLAETALAGDIEVLRGALVGTDLDIDEVHAYAHANGDKVIPIMLELGPSTGAAATWADGLLTGLELARLRQAEENTGGRLRALRGGLEAVRRIILTAPAGDASGHITRAVAVIDVLLEGEAEDNG